MSEIYKIAKIVSYFKSVGAPQDQKMYVLYFFIFINATMEQLIHPLPIIDLLNVHEYVNFVFPSVLCDHWGSSEAVFYFISLIYLNGVII